MKQSWPVDQSFLTSLCRTRRAGAQSPALHAARPLVLLIALQATLPCALHAQVPAWSWTQAAATAQGPGIRYNQTMSYDSIRAKTVMFGGYNGSYLGDTWEWDGATWAQRAATGPLSRYAHAMCYDSRRARTVMFGGYNTGPLGDTWEWNGAIWSLSATPIQGPLSRFYHAMCYDSSHARTLLFGGYNNVSSSILGDTWEWDGAFWTQIQLTSPVPVSRYGHAMSYNSSSARTVMFGGYTGISYLGDTWEWDGANWTQVALTAQGPGIRDYHKMSYDSSSARTVMFGGQNGSSYLGDTWTWDGATWSQVNSNAQGPASRSNHVMSYDSRRRRTVMFGGRNSGNLDDVWEFRFLSASALAYGTGCGSPSLTISPGTLPQINTIAQALLSSIPSSVAFVSLGWSNTSAGAFALPLPLDRFGLPGCILLQSAEIILLPVISTGSATETFSLPLPNIAGLQGLHIYLQGWAIAQNYNSGNLVTSNGLEWIIGL